MKKLSHAQIKTRDQIAQSLDEVAEEIRQVITKTNELLDEARGSIETLAGRYNELIWEANYFMAGVHDVQESFFGDRSESWQVGDAGQAYQNWVEEWSNDLEEMEEIEIPDPIEEPEFNAITELRDLPHCL